MGAAPSWAGGLMTWIEPGSAEVGEGMGVAAGSGVSVGVGEGVIGWGGGCFRGRCRHWSRRWDESKAQGRAQLIGRGTAQNTRGPRQNRSQTRQWLT